jgi:hypothetical protein
MTTIDLFPSDVKKSDALSLKCLCKKYLPGCLLFIIGSACLSLLLCRVTSNRNQSHFEQLEELIQDVEYSGELTAEQHKKVLQIRQAYSDSKSSCDYLESFDPSLDFGLKFVQKSASPGSLGTAFSLLESLSYYKSKGEHKKALDTQNDLKSTLDHKSFTTDKRESFNGFLKSMNIRL